MLTAPVDKGQSRGPRRHGLGALLVYFIFIGSVAAKPLPFSIPAQPADRALAAFTQQSQLRILYSPTELAKVDSTAVVGEFEPMDALVHLLLETGYGARLRDDHFIVTRIPRPRSSILGRIETINHEPFRGTRVSLPQLRRVAVTNRHGEFRFDAVPLGTYVVVAEREGFQPLHINGVQVTADDFTHLRTDFLRPANASNQLEPVVVEGRLTRRGPLDPGPTIWGPRRAGGNLDLTRTANDVLPFIIYDRDRITRSGAVNLNEFLRRELLDTDATALPPEQGGGGGSPFSTGSSNLSLRGFQSDETVILVNGRRLPEVLTALRSNNDSSAPDVNFIPLSLVQQVQVLPASSSALYSGNAVGGVINILLRPDNLKNATEVTATYTNATEGFDAPNTSVSLLHNQVLLDGRLSVRLNANFVETTPATDGELKYLRDRPTAPSANNRPQYGATPNIRTTDGKPLLPDWPSAVTSVAPGSDGTTGLTAFNGREGIRNETLYDSPGTLGSSPRSIDFPYGRRQKRDLYFASAIYEVSPWLELGFDAAYSSTKINRGYNIFAGDLLLRSDNPLNPFGKNIKVSLLETPSDLGQDYNEASLDFYSLVGSALVTLPWDFKLIGDIQYSRSATRYRGINDVDMTRWQQLVDRGDYNPLRDTQVFAPPSAFYDEVLVYTGARDAFVTVGDNETFDGSFRLTHDALPLPTGQSVFNFGADYRIGTLKSFNSEYRYGDGAYQKPPERWVGRTLERVSVFTELQAPIIPRQKLPTWIDAIETDLATRFIFADTSAETNIAPTIGLKFDFAGGIILRGSFTTSNRFPTPFMSRNIGNGLDAGGGARPTTIYDPVRNESYNVRQRTVLNPGLASESAVTQTIGFIYERGDRNRFRVALDFFDTRKTNEIVGLFSQNLVNLESHFRERVIRTVPEPGDSSRVGRINELRGGAVNLARRHSQNWMLSLDFARSEVFGGTLDLRSRIVYFQRFDLELFADDDVIDEIRDPSGGAGGLLEYRATFGGGWSNKFLALGFDGQYFHSRRLPQAEWPSHGARTIDPYWQTDFYLQADLGHWLLASDSGYGLKGQLRVNNVFKKSYPYYANDETGAGVQPYGDWRGRTLSLSVTAEF